jgi:hypothetical protein
MEANELPRTFAGISLLAFSALLPSGAGATTGPLPPECLNPNLSAAEQSRCDFIARTPTCVFAPH